MVQWKEFITNTMTLAGFTDWKAEVDEEHKHGTVFIHDTPALIKENLPALVESFNYLIQLIAKKNDQPPIFLDINNYRRERETLITELARAAARKVLATGEAISLPAMNSYERRIVHVALAVHPEVFTESVGAGKERYVVVKRLEEKKAGTSAEQKAD